MNIITRIFIKNIENTLKIFSEDILSSINTYVNGSLRYTNSKISLSDSLSIRNKIVIVSIIIKYKRQIKNTIYYHRLSNGPLEGINNKIKVIKRISYGYRSFSNFKAKVLLVFSLFTPSETNKKPRHSIEEHQTILTKKKKIKLKRKNRKKAILLNIA